MRPHREILTLASVPNTVEGGNYDLDHFASNVTGGTWTLSNTSTTDGIAHLVSLYNDTTTDHSAKTVTFIGTDEDNKSITETINMPGPNTGATIVVKTTNYFKTLTSATPSATIGSDTMDIGIADIAVTKTIPLDWRNERMGMNIIISGTINYTVQSTTNFIQTDPKPFDWLDINDPSIVDSDTSEEGNYDFVPPATRMQINSYDTGATAKWTLFQMDSSI
jgi:hypothetical protein